jgi:hypothetical protein
MSFEGKHSSKFWQERFGTPQCARNYHYYAYEYLDDLSFLPSALAVFDAWHQKQESMKKLYG